MAKLIFGCGYLGRRVARAWIMAGQRVFAVTRSADRASALAAERILPIVADVTDPASMAALPDIHTVLVAIGFDRHGGHSIHRVYVEGLRNLLAALPGSVQRLLYISSTGVYGQTDGSWVDERSECKPERSGGRACLEAEQLLQQHPLGRNAVILRAGGIYGSGRVPRQDLILSGQPIAAPTDGFLNLIHVDDLTKAVLIAEAEAPSGSLYCLTDGEPVVREAYYRYLAQQLGAPEPSFTEPPEGAHVAQRSQSNKRVDSRRFREQFNFQPGFPSYREGLAEAVSHSLGPDS